MTLDCQTGSIATGIGNVIGNKGGVGVGLLLKGTSFLFVNSHLTGTFHFDYYCLRIFSPYHCSASAKGARTE